MGQVVNLRPIANRPICDAWQPSRSVYLLFGTNWVWLRSTASETWSSAAKHQETDRNIPWLILYNAPASCLSRILSPLCRQSLRSPEGRGSYSIDEQRYNFQFGGDTMSHGCSPSRFRQINTIVAD